MSIDLKAKPFYLDGTGIAWVNSTLSAMTTEEKVGQLFCVLYKEGRDEELEYTYSLLEPGGCMYRTMPLDNALAFTEKLRSKEKIPLLIAANLEKGGNGIVTEGTLMGSPMEVAATDDVTMAEKLGQVCAQESKAVGANWAFAPIIDIDYNFRNPITNTRTFGSDPTRVREMGVAYTKAVQQLGVAASIKHFPGDGMDERDQHLVTSINSMDCEEWDQTYGAAYQACIDAGALSCMIGHIMQPAYSRKLVPGIKDEEIRPASLASELMNGLLRGKLGFNGLIVTDATTMAGFAIPMPRSQAVPRCIAAGADMFLFARNLKEDFGFMMEGVQNGTITPERLDEAVVRILATKAALMLHEDHRPLCLDEAKMVVGCAQHQQWARECAEKSVTLVKQEEGVLPLSVERFPSILLYPIEAAAGVSQYGAHGGACLEVAEALRGEGFDVTIFEPSTSSEGHTPPTTAVTETYNLILYIASLSTKSNQTAVRIEWAQPMGANCPHYITEVPTVFVSLENPYHLLDVPRVRTFINTYSSNPHVIRQLVDKLVGRSEFVGNSPVDATCGKWDARLQ